MIGSVSNKRNCAESESDMGLATTHRGRVVRAVWRTWFWKPSSDLKAGKRTVHRLAASGKLPAFKLDGTWRFLELDQWIASRIGKATMDDDEGAA